MKKFLTLVCMAAFGLTASAQKDVKAVGANLSYGLDSKVFGFGAKGQYGFTKEIRGEASFNYFLEGNDNTTRWDLNANVHYLFPMKQGFTLYPLAGLSYTHVSVDFTTIIPGTPAIQTSGSVSKWGLNFGGGIEKDLSANWKVNAELKYQLISNYGQLVPSIGVAYKF